MLDWLFPKPLSVGDAAPDFSVDDVTLSGLRGKNVVLVFYPLDWSPVCSNQLPDIESDRPKFDQLGTQVLGISVGAVKTRIFRAVEALKSRFSEGEASWNAAN